MTSDLFPLPEVRFPLSVDTIGQHLALGYEVWASCDTTGCNHTVRVNLVVVAKYLGSGHGARAEDLKPYFYCPKCREAGQHDRLIDFTHFSCTAPHSIVVAAQRDNQVEVVQAKAG
ncbi:MAG: hypothetical protein M9924_17625 [Rhizobiaceae bacterium]|nr:hypothetical protein [Rhizobiaceae bacterium]